MTYFPKITIAGYDASASTDAFNRLRVSDPAGIWASKLLVDNQPLFWDDQETSGGGTSSTYNTNKSSVTLATTASTAGTRVRQTKRRMLYQPGKSQLILCTFTFTSAAASGVTRRAGYFDEKNGVFLEQDGTTVNLVRRTYTSGSAVDTEVAQASWSEDPMDGTGPSGATLDLTKSQILVIDMEWLGVGTIRVGFAIDGVIYIVHKFNHSNTGAGVYMTIPNLPIRYELVATAGAGANASLECICSMVASEGGSEFIGTQRVIDRGTTVLTTLNDSNLYPLCAIRLKSTHLMADVAITGIDVLCGSSAIYRWALLLNPTVTGTALSYTSLSNSAVEYDVSTTNATTVSAGTIIESGYGSSTIQTRSSIESSINDLRLGSLIAGTADVVVLAAQRITGTTVDFYGGITWRETL